MTDATCQGCSTATPEAALLRTDAIPTHHLTLPGIHCASCIRSVETTLAALPGVVSAHVNLTRKRVAIAAADPDADPTRWIYALARAGYEAHEAAETDIRTDDDLLLHLGVAGFAMMNVMLLSVAIWSGAADSTREFLHWISAAIALPAAAFAAQPFFRNAWRALRVGSLNMDVPISLAIFLACAMSLFEVINGGAHAWFDAALSLTFFLLAGRVLDQRLRRTARSAADDLAALEPSRVHRIEAGTRTRVPIGDIAVGDTLWLAAGDRVPVDAVLLDTSAQIDRSAITGESDPVTRRPGAPLLAGEIALTGPVKIRATTVGEDTSLRRVTRLVANAENARSRYRSLADKAASIYTPAVHIIAAAAFTGTLITTGDLRAALNVAIATLIITCPCALGLAVPAVAVAATSQLYRRGLLVKSETALERLDAIDTVIFDKTGTLTERQLVPPDDLPDAELQVLKSLSEGSNHPLCRRLARTLEDVSPANLAEVSEITGVGVSALWQGTPVSLGRGTGSSPETLLEIGGRTYPLASVETAKTGAADAVAALKSRGLHVRLLTGDCEANAQRIAAALGIDDVLSTMRLDQKLDVVRDLQAKGRKVLMIGDGLNDTGALAAADASMAPGSALDASRNAADIVLVTGDLEAIAFAYDTARTAKRRALQNFALAAVYNAIAVPVAVVGLATPLMAAIAMSASSITVIANSLRWRGP